MSLVGRIEVEPRHDWRSRFLVGEPTPRWHLTKRIRFESSHLLPKHDGKCARLHGHSWIADTTITADRLMADGPQKGMAFDYGRLKEMLAPIEDALDHRHLNDIIENPTSEAIAQWIAEKVAAKLRGKAPPGVELYSVTVHETCTALCTFYPA